MGQAYHRRALDVQTVQQVCDPRSEGVHMARINEPRFARHVRCDEVVVVREFLDPSKCNRVRDVPTLEHHEWWVGRVAQGEDVRLLDLRVDGGLVDRFGQ